jgi:hypothetical protein
MLHLDPIMTQLMRAYKQSASHILGPINNENSMRNMPLAGICAAQSATKNIVDDCNRRVQNDASTISIRSVMGLKKMRAFLIEREKP